LVLGEETQPDSYIRYTTLQGAPAIFEKIKGFLAHYIIRKIRYISL